MGASSQPTFAPQMCSLYCPGSRPSREGERCRGQRRVGGGGGSGIKKREDVAERSRRRGEKGAFFSSRPLNPPRPFRRRPSLLPALFSYLSFLPFSPPPFFSFPGPPPPLLGSNAEKCPGVEGEEEKKKHGRRTEGGRGKGGGGSSVKERVPLFPDVWD